jgi:3-methylfumaryl-CoA hydratase
MSLAELFAGSTTGIAPDVVGRTEQRWGSMTPELAGMMSAAVSHPVSLVRDTRRGSLMPRLWHWAAFPDFVPLDQVGPDGHAKLGGFLPDLGFSRRMWAGGKLTFHGSLRIGELLRRTSTIRSVTPKTGAAGDMVFVTVRHHIEGETGSFVEEDQDLVYLHSPERFMPPKRIPELESPDFDEVVAIDAVRLFRFSAATFNSHRIHYDLSYAQEVEKYPGLVTHGPMQAVLLMETAKRHTGTPPARFSFRGVHPMFHTHDLRLQGRLAPGGRSMDLGTAAPDGYLGMTARAEWD